jgi:hypothetical protein
MESDIFPVTVKYLRSMHGILLASIAMLQKLLDSQSCDARCVHNTTGLDQSSNASNQQD